MWQVHFLESSTFIVEYISLGLHWLFYWSEAIHRSLFIISRLYFLPLPLLSEVQTEFNVWQSRREAGWRPRWSNFRIKATRLRLRLLLAQCMAMHLNIDTRLRWPPVYKCRICYLNGPTGNPARRLASTQCCKFPFLRWSVWFMKTDIWVSSLPGLMRIN